MQDFRKLIVWEKAHALALQVYSATGRFPRSELYGLTSQMRRASFSIPTNIAEGCGTRSDAELARFLTIAFSSASELEYHLLLAKDLTFLDVGLYEQLAAQTTEVKRMLSALIRKVEARVRGRH